VVDDDGHVFVRGKRMAVCDKTFRIMTHENGPYAEDIFGIEPRTEIPAAKAEPFSCRGIAFRNPRQTKGLDYDATLDGSSSCTTDGCC
jgi:hypothetical protein